MSDSFRRGGFEDAIPILGEQTTLRPVEEPDVDLLIAWHTDPDVSRFWDDETFTRATRNAGFVEVSRHEPDAEHTAAWVLLEFSPR